jgi:AcrR family transcriptional regulator
VTRITIAPGTTREKILDSAFTLFGRYGFKRTSMEDIAGEAGLSRAALYLQFRNKEDIFRALATRIHEQCLGQAQAALAAEGPLEERLRAAIEGKTLLMVEIGDASPHGAELMDERNRLCGDLASDSERRFLRMLTSAFQRAARSGEIDLAAARLSASEAADLFAGGMHGLKIGKITPGIYRKRVAAFARVFVTGLNSPRSARR